MKSKGWEANMDWKNTKFQITQIKEMCPELTPLELLMPLLAMKEKAQRGIRTDKNSMMNTKVFLEKELSKEEREILLINKSIYAYYLVTLAETSDNLKEELFQVKKALGVYKKAVEEGWEPGTDLFICSVYFAGKPDENLQPLWERLEKIQGFRQELITSALLAASYYGMEELHMRLPALEAMLINPFGKGKEMQAVSGSIMIADGGPAEGAKAMQLYMFLSNAGLEVEKENVIRMIGLLAILASKPTVLGQTILDRASEIERETGILKAADTESEPFLKTEAFLLASGLWVWEKAHDEETLEQMNITAMNLLTGMPQEVAAILAAVSLL